MGKVSGDGWLLEWKYALMFMFMLCMCNTKVTNHNT